MPRFEVIQPPGSSRGLHWFLHRIAATTTATTAPTITAIITARTFAVSSTQPHNQDNNSYEHNRYQHRRKYYGQQKAIAIGITLGHTHKKIYRVSNLVPTGRQSPKEKKTLVNNLPFLRLMWIVRWKRHTKRFPNGRVGINHQFPPCTHPPECSHIRRIFRGCDQNLQFHLNG